VTGDAGHPDRPISDEMAEYLPVFLDETEQQLEELVETLLVLEREPDRAEELGEAFRLVHSIKGSAGLLGLDSIAVLAHHLESRFEALRSGVRVLDRPMMDLALRCVDFLRECTRRLRAGEALSSDTELIAALDDESAPPEPPEPPESPSLPDGEASPGPHAGGPPSGASAPIAADAPDGALRVVVEFEPGLPLSDLKARLIAARLADVGEVVSTVPDAEGLAHGPTLERFEVVLVTDHDPESVRCVVELDGVRTAEVRPADAPGGPVVGAAGAPAAEPDAPAGPEPAPAPGSEPARESAPAPKGGPSPSNAEPAAPASASRAPERARPGVAETVRVDIDRLDRLMNLAGELVVNRARFVQVTDRMRASFRGRRPSERMRDVAESLSVAIDRLRERPELDADLASVVEELEAGLGSLGEQSRLMDDGRRGYAEIGEAVDQLTRIANSLQQGVLETRMVPVAPLFNRFRRVVRDLSTERGKRVSLEIHGEKTELDKRMIDELGDPLVHLVRNAIDHGMEPPDVRRERGKPEVGTIRLSAFHSGNNVYIAVEDDGGGIDAERVRARVIERALLPEADARRLPDESVLEYIWHPGFSTAETVTDISGRGVGMDVVRTRISDLKGSVDVDSRHGEGTRFTIRLPLTLAIIRSLLIRIRGIIFAMPIDDVREIVSVPAGDVVDVHGKRTIDVRGEFIPLVCVDDVFDWQDVEGVGEPEPDPAADGEVRAVILEVGGRVMGLRVDEPMGCQDTVIKSLSDNFVQIRGLAGASILGDGTVCLMLDAGALLDRAMRGSRGARRARGAPA
jgi:two-component system chemotaxis sensor kinase CheA